MFSARDKGVEYSISHYDGHFYVLTNKDGATNFKLMVTDEENTTSDYWKELIPHREAVLLEDIEIFKTGAGARDTTHDTTHDRTRHDA